MLDFISPSYLLFSLVLTIYVLFILVTWCHVIVARQRLSAIPRPPYLSFYYGHSIILKNAKLDNTFMDVIGDWFMTYGKTFLLFLRDKNIIFTVAPDVIKEVVTNTEHFSKFGALPNRALYGQRLVGWKSILSGGGPSWALKRRIMTRFFSKTNSEGIFDRCRPRIEKYVESVLKRRVGQGKVMDLMQQLGTIFMAVPGYFGVHEVYDAEVIGRKVTKILDMIKEQIHNHGWRETLGKAVHPEKHHTVQMIIELRKHLHQMVQDRVLELEHVDVLDGDSDLLGLLIRANEACGWDEDELVSCIVDDIITIYLVMDNNVKQLAALFITLARYPEVYRKLVKELRALPALGFSSLMGLPYTEQVLLESLRIGPALLRGTRQLVGRSRQLGPYLIPSHTQVHFCQYLVHRDEEYWSDQAEFRPERWAAGFKPAPGSFLPFLMGPRGCLGKHFAMVSIKLVLANLLRNFDLRARFEEGREPVMEQGYAVMRIRNDVMFEFVPVED